MEDIVNLDIVKMDINENIVSPFDVLAENYDTDFTQAEIGKLQRERVWQGLYKLLAVYDRPLKILEINCGTGYDALKLAAMGHSVMATDASAMMIRKASEKLLSAGNIAGKVEFMQCSFGELAACFSNEKFDLIFSNFGGLNCIPLPAIQKLSNDLVKLVCTNGYVFLTVMSRFCVWEIVYFLSKAKLSTAFRRQKESILFGKGEQVMPIYYYSPRQLIKLFEPYFKPVHTYSAGLFIPPSYLEQQFIKNKSTLRRLARWEQRLGNYSWTARFADHFCIAFKKHKG